jgi:uncharacterized protein
MKLLTRLALLPLTLVMSVANASSFDCSKAKTLVEHRICDDAYLGKLDETLQKNYANRIEELANAPNDEPTNEFRQEQRAWLKARNTCTTTECLVQAYQKRIDETCSPDEHRGGDYPCSYAQDVH